jgi:pyruvate dehydrogenase E2 component (dihydrolipoamide acetyltransferase)
MAEFRMPSLGADMVEGKVTAWHVGPGDEVHHGDVVATVDTSKAEIDIEIFEDGVVDEILVPVGETVEVGVPLATIRGAGVPAAVPAAAPEAAPVAAAAEAPPPVVAQSPPAAPPVVAAPPVAAPLPAAAPEHNGHRRRVSPLARRVAAELGVDLDGVTGTGPHGSVCRADVERAAAQPAAAAPPAPPAPVPPAPPPPPAPPAPAAADRAAAMRQTIGALMARSKREIPHYYLAVDVDMSRALDWLEQHNRELPLLQRVVPAALLLRATARAAARFGDFNGFFTDGAFRPSEHVHLGVAISLRGGGLVAPAIHDADTKSVDELMTGLRDLVRRARAGGLRGSEMSDPTITVTNLGEQGVPVVYGVIYPPQVALVGFGAIRERPWAENGMLAVRPVVTATLSADHRAGDGHTGGLFLAEIDRLLQAPEEL